MAAAPAFLLLLALPYLVYRLATRGAPAALAPAQVPPAVVAAKHSMPQVSFVWDREMACGFLVVHNLGDAAAFSALIYVKYGVANWPTFDVSASWDGSEEGEIEIATGSSRKIIVGQRAGKYTSDHCCPRTAEIGRELGVSH